MVTPRPVLELYVTRDCAICRRAERVIRECDRLAQLVELRVVEFGTLAAAPPPAVVGGPSTVFRGMVLALGTPDCTELAARIESILTTSVVE